MTYPSPTRLYADTQIRQLDRFIPWSLVIIVVTAALQLTIAIIASLPIMFVLAGAATAIGIAMLVARSLIQGGRVQVGVLAIALTLMVVAVVIFVLVPDLLVIFLMLPVMMVALALPYTSDGVFKALIFASLVVTIALVVIGPLTGLTDALPREVAALLQVALAPVIIGLTLLLMWQFRRQLSVTLAEAQLANAQLRAAQAQLESLVAERTAELQGALVEVHARVAEQERLLEENAQQRDALREMSVPVLPLSSTALVMPLVGELGTDRLREVQEQALQHIARSSTKHLILDITGVSLIDTQVALGLIQVGQAARLLGAEMVLVGIRPEVAQTIVGLGIQLDGMVTRSSLQDGIAYALTDARGVGAS